DAPAQGAAVAAAGGPPGDRGHRREDDGQGPRGAVPHAPRRGRGPGAVDADAHPAPARARDAAVQPRRPGQPPRDGRSRPRADALPLPRPAAADPAEVLPAEDDAVPSWDKLAADTENPAVAADTATGVGSRSAPSGRKRHGSRPVLPVVQGRRPWIVVAAVTA